MSELLPNIQYNVYVVTVVEEHDSDVSHMPQLHMISAESLKTGYRLKRSEITGAFLHLKRH